MASVPVWPVYEARFAYTGGMTGYAYLVPRQHGLMLRYIVLDDPEMPQVEELNLPLG